MWFKFCEIEGNVGDRPMESVCCWPFTRCDVEPFLYSISFDFSLCSSVFALLITSAGRFDLFVYIIWCSRNTVVRVQCLCYHLTPVLSISREFLIEIIYCLQVIVLTDKVRYARPKTRWIQDWFLTAQHLYFYLITLKAVDSFRLLCFALK